MTEYRDIVNPSFPVFCLELEEALKDGFEIDGCNLPHASFTFYEAHLLKDSEVEYVSVQRIEEAEPVKMAVKRVGRQAKV